DWAFREDIFEAFERSPAERLHLEAIIIDYEAALHLAIGGRACQIAGLSFMARDHDFHQPTRPKSLPELLARIGGLVAMCADIERLAQLRAQKLLRQREADPLGSEPHHIGRLSLRPMH